MDKSGISWDFRVKFAGEQQRMKEGGGFQGLTHGQHRAAPKKNAPLAHLWTTMMLQAAGARIERFADADATANSIWG